MCYLAGAELRLSTVVVDVQDSTFSTELPKVVGLIFVRCIPLTHITNPTNTYSDSCTKRNCPLDGDVFFPRTLAGTLFITLSPRGIAGFFLCLVAPEWYDRIGRFNICSRAIQTLQNGAGIMRINPDKTNNCATFYASSARAKRMPLNGCHVRIKNSKRVLSVDLC